MKQVVVFQDIKGKNHATEAACSLADSVIAEIEYGNSCIDRAIDSHCDFANGGGFVQHTAEGVQEFINRSEVAIRLECGDTEGDMFKQQPRGFVGRYLDDGNRATYALWGRLCNIDSQHREYGQMFYALNPDKVKGGAWANILPKKP